MHAILNPRHYDNLLISVIYFSLKENEVSGYYLDTGRESCVVYVLI